MTQIMNGFLCLLLLIFTVDTRAGSDNLNLSRYSNASSLPRTFYQLGGGSRIAKKTYIDDEGKTRSDKVYYTATHSYFSSYRTSDILRMLNPEEGRLDSLFENTSVLKSARSGSFEVMMVIATPIKDFNCASQLTFKTFKSGNKTIFKYAFSDFNMVFTDMVIQVEVEEIGSATRINLFQVAALKGHTYQKLSNFFAVGRFEKALKSNIKNFKQGIGGI